MCPYGKLLQKNGESLTLTVEFQVCNQLNKTQIAAYQVKWGNGVETKWRNHVEPLIPSPRGIHRNHTGLASGGKHQHWFMPHKREKHWKTFPTPWLTGLFMGQFWFAYGFTSFDWLVDFKYCWLCIPILITLLRVVNVCIKHQRMTCRQIHCIVYWFLSIPSRRFECCQDRLEHFLDMMFGWQGVDTPLPDISWLCNVIHKCIHHSKGGLIDERFKWIKRPVIVSRDKFAAQRT